MKRHILTFLAAGILGSMLPAGAGAAKINVVATLQTYGNLARIVGDDRVSVTNLANGNEDPHFVRPKLSFSEKLAKADLFIDTGLDLELWVPALQDTAGNKKILSGAQGYVGAASGLTLLEKVAVQDRKEGDVHIYGNPHVYNCPVCLIQIAKNICTGLKKVDPSGKGVYDKNLKTFEARMHEKLYGKELVDIVGGKTLDKMALKGKLIDFLEEQSYEGKPLVDRLGGWLKQAMPIRGKKVVAYHKNWAYFQKVFGIEVVEYIEPKPGMPPTPKHVKQVIDIMKSEKIGVILAANYYDKGKIDSIAKKVGATPVIVSIDVGGEPGVNDVFDVTQKILDKLVPALGK
jgi:zinc/manganese transport system substrate-binding protein